jgi:hypothetical protein
MLDTATVQECLWLKRRAMLALRFWRVLADLDGWQVVGIISKMACKTFCSCATGCRLVSQPCQQLHSIPENHQRFHDSAPSTRENYEPERQGLPITHRFETHFAALRATNERERDCPDVQGYETVGAPGDAPR